MSTALHVYVYIVRCVEGNPAEVASYFGRGIIIASFGASVSSSSDKEFINTTISAILFASRTIDHAEVAPNRVFVAGLALGNQAKYMSGAAFG